MRQALPVAFVGDSGQDDRPTRTSRSTTMHSTGDQIRVRRVPHAVSGADAAAPRDREEECVAAGGDLVTHPPGSRAVPGSIPGCPVWQWRIRAVCRRSCCYAPFTGRPDRRRYEGAAPGARAGRPQPSSSRHRQVPRAPPARTLATSRGACRRAGAGECGFTVAGAPAFDHARQCATTRGGYFRSRREADGLPLGVTDAAAETRTAPELGKTGSP